MARLPLYHRVLVAMCGRGAAWVSSDELASAVGVSSAVLRKDLSQLGSYGTRGVGYDVSVLSAQLALVLGLSHRRPVVIVGVGNLGNALAAYRGFEQRGFTIVGLFDIDPARIGTVVPGSVPGTSLTIESMDGLDATIHREGVRIAVIATPADQAARACARLAAAGVTSILNFAPTVLSAPDGVEVRDVDLATELHLLAYHEQRRAPVAVADTMGERVS